MTRLALIEREKKRTTLVEKYAAKRTLLFAIINDSKASASDKFEARVALQKLPRNSSPVRHRNRCAILVVHVVLSVNLV